MFKTRAHSYLVIVWVLVLVSFVVAQDATASDEAALRALVDRYFSAYTTGDLNGYAALWSERAPDLPARRQAMERLFAAASYTFTTPRVSRLKVAGEQASVWISTTRTVARGSGTFVTSLGLALEFVRENGNWRLWREASAVVELASLLTAAKSDAERKALLATDRDLLTRDLLFLLAGQGDRLFARGDYSQALVVNQLMVRVAETIGSKPEEATAWRNIGNMHLLLRDYKAAIGAYQKSLAIVEGLDRKFELVAVWLSLGAAYAASGEERGALDAYQNSLALSEEFDDKGGAANALEAIARLHREQGRFQQAAEGYERVLPLREALRDRASVAGTLVNLAEVEYEQGEDERALGYYLRAVSVLESIGRLESLVNTLHNIANLYYLQGNYDLALGYYRRELDRAETANSLPGAAAALAGIGLIQSLYADYSASLDAFRKCLLIWRQLGNAEEIATAMQKVGRAYFAQGEFPKALEQFQQALEMREALKDRIEIAWALLDVGASLAAQREYGDALARDERSLRLFEELTDASGIGTALVHLSGLHFAQEDYTSAIELADRAASVAKAANDAEIFWLARYRGGRAQYRLRQYGQSRKAFTEAIATIEAQRAVAGDSRPQRAIEDKLAPYLAMVDVAINQNQSAEALHFAERAKMRSLKLLLENGRARITKTMTPAEQVREQELTRELITLRSQVNRERERKAPQPARLADLAARLQRTQLDADNFQRRLYSLRPDLRVLRGAGPAISLEKCASLLSSTGIALLEFVETDEGVYLLVFSRPQSKMRLPRLQAYALGVTRRELAERIARFQQVIVGRGEGWETQARELYDLLIKPAGEQLKSQTHLVVVPDGWLWNLPFAALQSSHGSFLLEQHAISITPSLTALSRMRVSRPQARTAAQLVAFANPALSRAAIERIKVARRLENLAPSPETESEVERLRQLYGANLSRVYVRGEARVDRVRAEAEGAKVLHLAIPATISEASPLYSQLAFAPPPGDSQADGLIDARELFGWDLKAEIVVLSSGEAVPKGVGTGRGLTGFSWALVVAGCRSSLLSQWRVEMPTTTELMVDFHREWRVSNQKANAWRTAAMDLWKKSAYRHPYYWAGFVVLGDGL